MCRLVLRRWRRREGLLLLRHQRLGSNLRRVAHRDAVRAANRPGQRGRETGRLRLHPNLPHQSKHRGRGQRQSGELATHLDQLPARRLRRFCRSRMGESPAPLLSRALGLKAAGKAVKERKPMKTFRSTVLSALLSLLASAPIFAATHTNTITGLSFVPRNMTITAGDTIVWVNVAFHSVTGSSAQEPFCGSTIFGASAVSCSATFNVPGTYNYYCRPHWMYNMSGSVTVQ